MSIQIIPIPGNRCGHVPTSPRLFNRPDHNKPRPHILEQAIGKLKDVYDRPKKFFKKLATFNPSNRQKRSERRERPVWNNPHFCRVNPKHIKAFC
jgi:hypothetical protein